jgi:hypothetical protein
MMSKITLFNYKATMRVAIPRLSTLMVGEFPDAYHRGS